MWIILRQWNRIVLNFHRSDFNDLKGNEILAKVNNRLFPNLQGLCHKKGKTCNVKIAGDNLNLRLCVSRDHFASPILTVQTGLV